MTHPADCAACGRGEAAERHLYRDAAREERMGAATSALKERMHTAWHAANGASAPCVRCGTV